MVFPLMNKCFVVFVITLSLSPAYADFKIMGGLNLSRYNVRWADENTPFEQRLGFQGGIGFEKKINHNILLEVDFMYFQKGMKTNRLENSGILDKYRLNVVSVPVVFRLRNRFALASSYFFVGGVEISAILSHNQSSDDMEPVDLSDSTSTLDFGLVFGGGYEFELQEFLFLFFEARYHWGLKNILNSPNGGEAWKTNSLLFVIGLRS